MRLLVCLSLAFLILLRGGAAFAAQADAREVARLNNCTPKKIEVYKQTLGRDSQTIYRIDCTMPKTKEDAAAGADALLVQCDGTLCSLLRPLTTGDKK